MEEIEAQAEKPVAEKGNAKLTVTSKIKELIKQHEMNCASNFGDALDREVETIVKRAVDRAKHNDRKTVRAGDL